LALYTNKFDDHIEQLKLTLSTFRENRLSCNPKKTELAYSRIEYLGFVLSADGIQMSEKRIEAIGKITAPKNVKELQHILGLFNFWRKFVPSYSRNSFHMRQLLRKDVKFQWTKECDRELQYLKEALTKPPILRPIDPRLPIYLQVDGSKWAMEQLYYKKTQMAIFMLYNMELKLRIQLNNSIIRTTWNVWR